MLTFPIKISLLAFNIRILFYCVFAWYLFYVDGEKEVILDGMRHWENKTCIRFRQKRAQDSSYIFFVSRQWLVY